MSLPSSLPAPASLAGRRFDLALVRPTGLEEHGWQAITVTLTRLQRALTPPK
jgi:hypothetical protein